MRFAVAVLFVGFLAVCQAKDMLKCFDCVDCAEKTGSPKTCEPEQDACMKIVAGDHVIRRCAKSDNCGIGKLERATDRVLTGLGNIFKDVPEDARFVYCCDDDYCNSGFRNIPSLVVLLLPLIFVSFFKF